MELCNAHNVPELVEQLYTEDALYYNHKPIIKGTESIIQEYDYMNKPDYQLKLEPRAIEIVNSEMVYEIGQCVGSYSGKYILIWKMVGPGEWKIFLDSNI